MAPAKSATGARRKAKTGSKAPKVVKHANAANLYRFIKLVLPDNVSDREIARRWGMNEKNFNLFKHGQGPVPRLEKLDLLAQVLEVERYYIVEAALGTPAEKVHKTLQAGEFQEKVSLVSSDLEKAVSLIQEERDFSERIIESIGDAYLLVTASGDVRRANHAARALAGDGEATDDELHGRNVLDFFSPGEAARVLTGLREVAGERENARLESTWIRPGSDAVAVDLAMSQITRGGEALVQLLVRDVSDRKRAEEELRLRSELIERIMENVHLGMYLVDRALRIVYWNRARELGPIGFKAEDVKDKPLLERVAPEERPQVESDLRAVLDEGRIIQRETVSEKGGLRTTYRVTRQPIRNREGEVTHVLTIGEKIVA